ncbi:MAG: DnaA/Hda family protein [Planctomycetota bacterium]|jgi:chromosomal replication initiator protein|nr:DnaA/Hda family protein [Planctomycetota bacterium]
MARRRNVPAVSYAVGSTGEDLARGIQEQLRRRIGDDRYAVWFGEAAQISVALPGDSTELAIVSVAVGSGFSHDWLRKTFRADVEAAVDAVCGPQARVEWREGNETIVHGEPVASPRHPPHRRRQNPSPVVSGPTAPTERRHMSPAVPVGRRPVAGLDSFVVGPSNRMAFAAVELAVTRPGEMSPLFLYGPSGVGKTHLLEAFCGQIREQQPGGTTVFLSAEQFTTAFLQSLHGSGLPGFRRSCRQADLLVIDELQFFVGKRATIEEFQQTIDALLRNGRQMVFAADRDLDALGGLGPDLLVRLKGGMQARILPPDENLRRGILAGLAARRGLQIPEAVVDYVAANITRHARELVGAVNRLEAASHMLGLPISLGMAEEALVDLVRSSRRGVRLADIERAVCTAFGIEPGSLQTARRSRHVNQPRMLAMFLARKHTSSALTEIGGYFGRRSHSTVITAQKTVATWLSRRESVQLADAAWDAEEAIRRVEDLLRVG